MSENTADGTVETPTVEDLQAKLAKAEAKIVDMKKSSTKEPEVKEVTPETTEKPVETNNFMTREDYESEEFFKNNNELKEHKDYILEKVSKGNTWEEAKALLKLKDPTIENREKTKQSNFTYWDVPVDKTTFTEAQLWDMTQEDYNRAMDAVDAGKAKVA